MRLENKTCVITAAGAGIGKATALAFAENGAQVIATDINEESLATIDHPSIKTVKLDVLDGDAIKKFAAEYSNTNVLFNCAGFVHNGTILDCEESDWDFSFDLNVKSMYHMRPCRGCWNAATAASSTCPVSRRALKAFRIALSIRQPKQQ